MSCSASIFFNTKIKNNDSTLENMGNACFSPVRQIFGGREVIRIKNENAGDNYIVPPKKIESVAAKVGKIFLSVIFLVPGLILGTLLKGASLLSKSVREYNSNYKTLFNDKTEANDLITESNGDKYLLLGDRQNLNPTITTYRNGYPWSYLGDSLKKPESLNVNNFNNTHIEALFNKNIDWEAVKTVDLTGCETLCDDTLAMILQKCPNIEHFDITGCTTLTNKAFKIIGKKLDDKMLIQLLENTKNTDFLNLSNCKKLTSAGIDKVCELKELKGLNLSFLRDIVTCEHITKLVNSNNNLLSLGLNSTLKHLTKDTANALANHKCLRGLHLTNATNLKNDIAQELLNLKSLQVLNLTGCRGVEVQTVDAFKQNGITVTQ